MNGNQDSKNSIIQSSDTLITNYAFILKLILKNKPFIQFNNNQMIDWFYIFLTNYLSELIIELSLRTEKFFFLELIVKIISILKV
jgi:hypothetical protein